MQHNDRLLELTKTGSNPLPFVRHDLFPDDWNGCGMFVMDDEVWSRDTQQQIPTVTATTAATKLAQS